MARRPFVCDRSAALGARVTVTVTRSTNAKIAAITIRQRGSERLGSVEKAMSNSHDEKMQYMSAYQAR